MFQTQWSRSSRPSYHTDYIFITTSVNANSLATVKVGGVTKANGGQCLRGEDPTAGGIWWGYGGVWGYG